MYMASQRVYHLVSAESKGVLILVPINYNYTMDLSLPVGTVARLINEESAAPPSAQLQQQTSAWKPPSPKGMSKRNPRWGRLDLGRLVVTSRYHCLWCTIPIISVLLSCCWFHKQVLYINFPHVIVQDSGRSIISSHKVDLGRSS